VTGVQFYRGEESASNDIRISIARQQIGKHAYNNKGIVGNDVIVAVPTTVHMRIVTRILEFRSS
jgi:hypothetical protein